MEKQTIVKIATNGIGILKTKLASNSMCRILSPNHVPFMVGDSRPHRLHIFGENSWCGKLCVTCETSPMFGWFTMS